MNEAVAQVLALFEHNDVVLLGESHGIAQNLELVCELVPHLRAVGVTDIALEFSAEEFQADSDSMINAAKYVPQIARNMLFGYNAGWPYVEYQQVHHAVWSFNQYKSPDARLRVLHASYVFDWTGWQGNRDWEYMQQVFKRGHYNEFRADRIDGALAKGGKVLGLFGAFHAYRKQMPIDFPEWLGRTQTLGQLLSERHPDRIASVHLGDAMPGDWDLELQLAPANELRQCKIDRDFIAGRDFAEVQRNWPDPDWTPTPTDEADYWRIIEARNFLNQSP